MNPGRMAIATIRHVLSIVILPGTVLILVPVSLLRLGTSADLRWTETVLFGFSRVAGIALFAAGFGLFTWCVALFARIGRGTLAPWDPTRRFVATGPYRYARNPMISAVALMLTGQALFFGSVLIAAWAVVFVSINHVYFLVAEEPGLERRFGSNYLAYKRDVSRWLPRKPR